MQVGFEEAKRLYANGVVSEARFVPLLSAVRLMIFTSDKSVDVVLL